jgi:hypothetical protein
MSWILTLVIVLAALALGLALAYLPMRLLMATMARNVKQFIMRQRDRRVAARDGSDRRKAQDPGSPV